MKRFHMFVALAVCAMGVIGRTAPANVVNRAEVTPVPPPDLLQSEATPFPNLYFNTGGAAFTPPTIGGSASGWAYYVVHEYHCSDDHNWYVFTFDFPTNEYSTDPIAIPVEWVADCNVGSIEAILSPYSHDWQWRGTFYPAGAPDTSPPDTYTRVWPLDSGAVIYFGPQHPTMVWGYENAGLCGMISYNGVETVGWYVNYWDSDAPYGRTALLQFIADYSTPTESRSMSAIKSLY
jgi:hypothetical protein